MRDEDELFHLAAWPGAALVLGLLLAPVRELTTASNFTFLFLLLTILSAELGGRWAALATAICSSLSLNFFLTRPYMTLTIHGTDDIIAFLGLAVCGLVVAAFAKKRDRS